MNTPPLSLTAPLQTATPSLKPTPRLHFIDGLRGVAMMMVLLFHTWNFGGRWRVNLPFSHSINLAAALGLGHIGVHLFLVLSGFCLYWPFVKNGARRQPTLWEFAKKRCRRILPPYYVALFFFGGAALFQTLFLQGPYTLRYLLEWVGYHSLMLHNVKPDQFYGINGAFWSLALEFDLYILFPLLVVLFQRFPARGVVFAVLALSLVVRSAIVASTGQQGDGAYDVLINSVFARCFEFTAGMFAAVQVARRHRDPAAKLVAPLDVFVTIALLAAAVLGRKHGGIDIVNAALLGILFSSMLIAASRPHTFLHRMLSARGIVTLGIFSYSVYLIHQPLITAVGAWTTIHIHNDFGRMLFELLLIVPVMLGLGYVFHLFFEKPFMGTGGTPAETKDKRTDPDQIGSALGAAASLEQAVP